MIDMDESKRNFIDKCEQARSSLYQILLAYENLDYDENDQTTKNYPFGSSFDEWYHEYCHWMNELHKQWTGRKTFSPTITVGDLKKILNQYSDDRHVVIATKDWYINIGEIELPDDYATYTITLHTGELFDPIQIGK